MIFLGADPGTTGAIAIINEARELVVVADVPTVPIADEVDSEGRIKNRIHGLQLYALMREWLPEGEKCIGVLEHVQPFNGNAAMTGAMMGAKHTMWGIFDCLPEIELHLVTPATWKRHFKLTKPKVGPGMSSRKALQQTKADSKARCTFLYPSADIHGNDNRAEAILMAVYARQRWGPPDVAVDLFAGNAEPPRASRRRSSASSEAPAWEPFK